MNYLDNLKQVHTDELYDILRKISNETLYHLGFYSIQYRTHPDSLTSKKSYNENKKQLDKLHGEYFPYLTVEQKQRLLDQDYQD